MVGTRKTRPEQAPSDRAMLRTAVVATVVLGALQPAAGFFSAPLVLRVGGSCHRALAVSAPMAAARPAAGLRLRMVSINVEGGKSDEEECDGPAKEGAVGNVDMAQAKVSQDDIKTDGIINLTPAAIAQVGQLRASKGGKDLVLRVGVRAGGCSGMSYVMEFEDESQVGATDTEIPFDGFKVVVDPKSLMFVYGMTLNYSDALIGGGFQFSNPNADSTCGCGQSFGT